MDEEEVRNFIADLVKQEVASAIEPLRVALERIEAGQVQEHQPGIPPPQFPTSVELLNKQFMQRQALVNDILKKREAHIQSRLALTDPDPGEVLEAQERRTSDGETPRTAEAEIRHAARRT